MSGRCNVRERDVGDAHEGASRPAHLATWVIVLYEQARNWAIGSDPGLLRLRMATRTTAALVSALVILYLLTRATGQPLTVALLGVVIAMISTRAVNEPDPRRQKITMALLPVPAALAITAAALLASHRVAGDIVFVVVMVAAVYVRRFGPRGMALGMVLFMAYFFTLYLRAKTAELPWLIGAVLVGTLCSFVMSSYVSPDRPERVLRATMRSLRARMAIVVDTTAQLLKAGRLDERRRRRLRIRAARLNETVLMVQKQIEDRVGPARLWPAATGEQLALWLFDAELTVERVAAAGARAAAVVTVPASTRAALAGALTQLARAIRVPDPDGLRRAADLARQLLDPRPAPTAPDDPGATAVRRLALAINATASATSEVRALVERAVTESAKSAPSPASGGGDEGEPQQPTGLRPTTRQAIQVAVAASLAIVAGQVVSPARWYWAVIAAFVIFSGTASWAETLTKGWQRLLGTALGVPSGVLVATLVSGDTAVSIVLIFVCLFCGFYLMTVAYSLMIFCITTMLALLYGLLGEFTFDVLLLRIEETAIGAVIGVAVAILVLPTNIRTAIRNDVRAFWTTLSELVETSVAALLGNTTTTSPTEKARQLDRDLQRLRTTTKPLSAGVAGIAGRRGIRRGLRVLAGCDRFGRTLARCSQRYDGASPILADALRSAAEQTRRNIDALVAALDRRPPETVIPATDFLDTADTLARQRGGDPEPGPKTRRLLAALHALRQIDRAVVTAAIDLGAEDGVKFASR